MKPTVLIAPALLASLVAIPLAAQDTTEVRRERESAARAGARARAQAPIHRGIDTRAHSRAMIGVALSPGGHRDTLGVLIGAITPGSPAEQAGLEEGNRIAAINGVDLRLATADTGAPEMMGIPTRRLLREMQKVEPGAEVELRVWDSGQYRQVRLKTVEIETPTASRVRQTREERREEAENRPVLGVQLHASGTRRDTAGALLIRVATDGPAERAGLVEGDRVAAINGVDLRVHPADVGDRFVSNAKLNRFRRELAKVKPGDEVELLVSSRGQTRTVRVRAARAADVYTGHEGGVHIFFGGEASGMPAPHHPMPPRPPLPPMRMQIERARESMDQLRSRFEAAPGAIRIRRSVAI